MANDYNSIAKFYDALSRIVYQRSIINAQQYLIEFIGDNDKILLIGGGTGWVLEEISKKKKQNVSVIYVEKSSGMIDLSKKRNYANVDVEFINKPIEEYEAPRKFDIILTPFLLDNFLMDKIKIVFAKLDTMLKQNGIWLYTDFINSKENNKLWQRALLRTMYLFFRLTANIETQELIDMRPFFLDRYEILTEQFYYHHFIQAIAFRKTR